MPALAGEAILGGVPDRPGARADREGNAGPAPAATEDLDLARRCLAGEEAAQRTFVERYARIIFSVCRRKGLSPTLAEDVSQEVLADAFRGLRTYRGEARLSSWLFTLASRRVATHYRSAARQPAAVGHPGDRTFPAGAPDDGWEARFAEGERAAMARRAIETLEEPTRTILVAYYVAELSVREIAREQDLPEGTVKSHLHRGRKAVRARMGEP